MASTSSNPGLRTQLGRVRGPGSAKAGSHHWWLSRLTSLALIPLTLWFHFCAGIRHLIWDLGYGLELPQVYLGGWIVVGASVGLTILTWIVALIVW